MEFLKWIGYIIVSTVGLCALVLIVAFLWFFGTIVGAVLLAILVIFIVAASIKEHFEESNQKDP